ncbi:MAG: hypothetical protein ACREID_05015, partial [Planctomycetota bacterium]
TGLPFVFAAWYGDPAAEPRLERAGALGAERLAEYAAEASIPLGIPAAELETYLRERIRHRLGAREIAGLRRFLVEARHLGLL